MNRRDMILTSLVLLLGPRSRTPLDVARQWWQENGRTLLLSEWIEWDNRLYFHLLRSGFSAREAITVGLASVSFQSKFADERAHPPLVDPGECFI